MLAKRLAARLARRYAVVIMTPFIFACFFFIRKTIRCNLKSNYEWKANKKCTVSLFSSCYVILVCYTKLSKNGPRAWRRCKFYEKEFLSFFWLVKTTSGLFREWLFYYFVSWEFCVLRIHDNSKCFFIIFDYLEILWKLVSNFKIKYEHVKTLKAKNTSH